MTTIAAVNHPINCGAATTELFPVSFAKRSIGDSGYFTSSQRINRTTVAGTSSSVTVKDATYVRNTGATYETDYRPLVTPNLETLESRPITYSVSSLDEGVLAALDQDGLMSYVSNGKARIRTISSEGEASTISVNVASVSGATVDTFSSYVAGSLGANISSEIASRAVSQDRAAYSVRGGAGQYTRNPSLWASGIDWSCVSPWNSSGGFAMGGTLVTPRHVLFCRHFGFYPRAGASIKFVGMNGQSWDATIESTTENTGGVRADFAVAKLTEDAPGYIAFAKVLGSDWRDHLPTVPVNPQLTQSWEPSTGAELPVVYFTQDATVNLMAWLQIRDISPGESPGGAQSFAMRQSEDFGDFYQAVRLGDSGQPSFLIVDGEPAVVTVFTTGFTGTFVSGVLSVLNGMIDALGGGYQLTDVDLSGFPTY